VFDEAFKQMARTGGPVELAQAKGSIQEAARELGLDAGRISKWKQRGKKTDLPLSANSALTQEQQEIRRLQRELREAQLERDILKTGAPVRGRSASSPGETAPADRGGIPIHKGTR
jgi:transposase